MFNDDKVLSMYIVCDCRATMPLHVQKSAKNNLHARSTCSAIMQCMNTSNYNAMKWWTPRWKTNICTCESVWKCDKKFLSAYSTWLGIPTAGPAVGETAPAPGSGPDLVSFFKAENISGFVSNSARCSGDVFFLHFASCWTCDRCKYGTINQTRHETFECIFSASLSSDTITHLGDFFDNNCQLPFT